MALNNTRLIWKILLPLVIASVIAGLSVYYIFKDVYETRQIEGLKEKAKALVLASEAAREYSAELDQNGIIKDAFDLVEMDSTGKVTNSDKLVKSVPIVTSMEVLRKSE